MFLHRLLSVTWKPSLSCGNRLAAKQFHDHVLYVQRIFENRMRWLSFQVFKMAAIRTRPLENLLKFKPKNKEKRKHIYKKLITALVQYERVETTLNKCHDLSRVAERVGIHAVHNVNTREMKPCQSPGSPQFSHFTVMCVCFSSMGSMKAR